MAQRLQLEIALDGAGAVVVDARSVEQSLQRVGQAAQSLGADTQSGVGRAGASLDEIGKQATGAQRAVDALGKSGEGAAVSVGSIARASIGISILTGGVSALASALMALPSNALDYSRELETSAIGMAGIVSSLTTLNGKSTSFNDSLRISRGMMAGLADDALRTAASSQELVAGFQALLAPGLAAGMSMDQIRQLTVVSANAVKSMGLNSSQLVQEIRDLVQGGITASSSTLATALGLKDEDIAKAKNSSEGLFSFLMVRLKGFEEGSQRFGDTLSGRLDQLKEGAIRVTAAGLTPLAAALSEGARQAGAFFVQIDQAGNVQLNPQLVSSIAGYAQTAADAISVGGKMVSTLYEHRDAVLAVWGAYKAYSIGTWTAAAVEAVAAKIQLAGASRLAAVQAAAEAGAAQAVTLSTREQIAATLADLEAKVASARATAAQAAADLAAARARGNLTGLTMAGAAAQLSLAEATAAAAAAEEGLALATGRLGAAQAAASISTRMLSGAMALVGGPIGVAVTAFAALVMWIRSVVNDARDAQVELVKLNRLKGDLAAGKAPEATDLAAAQAALERFKKRRDDLMASGGDRESPLTYQRDAKTLADLNAQVAYFAGIVNQAQQASSGAAGAASGLALNLNATKAAWEQSTAGAATSLSVQQKYQQELQASQSAFEAYREALVSSHAGADALAQADAKQAAAEKAFAAERDRKLKEATASQLTALDVQLQGVKTVEQLKQQAYTQTADTLKSELTRGELSEDEYLARRVVADIDALSAKADATQAELALAKKRIGSEKEVAALTGQLAVIQAQYATTAIKYSNDLAEAEKKRGDAVIEAHLKEIAALQDGVQKLKDQVKQQREANEVIGLHGIALADVEAARLRDQATILQGVAIKRLDRDLDQSAYDLAMQQVEALRQLADLKQAGAVKQVAADSAKDAAAAWQKAADSINQSLTDALMRGFESGKGFAKNLADTVKNMFATMVLRPVIQAGVQVIGNGIANYTQQMFSQPGNGSAGAAGSGGMGGVGSMLGSAGQLSSMFGSGSNWSAGFSTGMKAYGSEAGVSGTADAGITAMGAGNVSGGMGTMAGIGASYAGAAMAGYAAGKAISGGHSIAGKSGNLAIGAGAAIGAYFGGPMGAALGAAIGGVVNRAFGRSQKKSVGSEFLSGTVSANSADVAANQYWKKDGGWFTSGATGLDTARNAATAAIGEQVQAQIRTTFDFMQQSVEALTGSASITDGMLSSVTVDLGRAGQKFATTQEGIAAALSYTSDAVVKQLVPGLLAFQREGETLTETATRLTSVFGVVDAATKNLGGNLTALGTGLGSAANKQALVDAFGGTDAFAAAAQSFYGSFYTETERAVSQGQQLAAAFDKLGVAMPTTRDGFRALVQSLDLTTDAGRKEYAALLQLAGAFDASQAAIDKVQATIDSLSGTLPMLADGMSDVAKATDALAAFDAQLATLRAAAADSSDVAARQAAEAKLRDLITSRYQAELQLAQALYKTASDTLASIAQQRQSIADSITSIRGGPVVMTADQLEAAIGQVTAGTAPSNAAVVAAQAAVDGWGAKLQAAQAYDASAAVQAAATASAKSMLDAAQTASKGLASDALYKQWDVMTATFSGGATRTATPDGHSISWDAYQAAGNQLQMQWETAASPFSNTTLVSRFAAYQDALKAYDGQLGSVTAAQTSYNAALAAESAWRAANPAPSTTADQATSQQLAAQTALSAAQAAYYADLNTYLADAQQGVARLTTLREETLRYYEAQKQLADLMSKSAAGLRGAVDNAVFQDKTPAEQFQALQDQFQAAYVASQTATGADLAGYGDTMQGLLQTLLDQAKSNVSVDYVAFRDQLLSEASSVADRISALTPSTYTDQTVALLDQIDGSLAALQAATANAQGLVVDAINLSRDQTVAALRAVIAAIQGDTVPGFAGGGLFGGGLRIVGEHGPELEATGPSRVWSAAQTRDILRGGSQRGATSIRVVDDAARQRTLLSDVSRQSSEAVRQQSRNADALNDVGVAVRDVGSSVERSSSDTADRVSTAVRESSQALIRAVSELRSEFGSRLGRLEDATVRQGRLVAESVESTRGRGLL